MTSGDNVLRPVEEFIPWSTRETFNQFEKLNEISSVAPFLKRPQTACGIVFLFSIILLLFSDVDEVCINVCTNFVSISASL